MNENTSQITSIHSNVPLGQRSDQWRPLIDPALRTKVIDVIHVVADRLSNPERLTTIAQKTGRWRQWNGFASVALPFLYLSRSFSKDGWEKIAQCYLHLAVEASHKYPLPIPGIYGGSSGMATVISQFYYDEPRYQKTYNTLNTLLARQVLKNPWLQDETGTPDEAYDVMSGAAGILGYLVSIQSPVPIVQEATYKLLNYLIWLAEDSERYNRKRFFIPPLYFPLESYREEFPDGYFNCGMIHGIAGPLAALAIAWQSGYCVDGQKEAIKTLSNWIVDHHVRDTWGINWPMGIPLRQSYSADEWRKLPSTQTSWSYGAPGVSRALWLAGVALEDKTFHQIALEGIKSALRRHAGSPNIISPNLCNGVAGLVIILLRFAHDTEEHIIHQNIPLLVNQLLDYFDSSFPLGFRNEKIFDVAVDDPGFLTGVSGILLTLLAASTTCKPNWDRMLLIR